MSDLPCPAHEQLQEYVTGILLWSTHEQVENHLDTCFDCQVRVDRIDQKSPALLVGYKNSVQSKPPDPELDRLIGKVQSLFLKNEVSPPQDSPVPRKGTILGNYQLAEEIGSGGMGRVFRAQHLRMKRDVAIKFLSPELLDSKSARQRFQREVEAAARLHHSHIVSAFDADEVEGHFFLVMEFIKGKNLAEIIKDQGPFSFENSLVYIQQAARGLAYAHQNGFIHRDIKPANLLLNEKGEVKVLDMGLARAPVAPAQSENANFTTSREMMGTASFMAPEQAANPRQVDHPADIYSLGCTWFYLLTGKGVYEEPTLMETIFAHREKPIPSLRKASPDCPPEADQLFQRMLAKRPKDRPSTMEEVIEIIDRLNNLKPPHPKAFPSSSRFVLASMVMAAAILILLFNGVPPIGNPPNQTKDDSDVLVVASHKGKPQNPKDLNLSPLPLAQVKESNNPPLLVAKAPPNANLQQKFQAKTKTPITKSPSIQLVRIEAGKFKMGAGPKNKWAAKDQLPQHEVQISQAFELGKFEVTRAQFAEVMGLRNKQASPNDIASAKLPISGIKWLTAIEFCNRLSQRHGYSPYYEVKGEKVRILGGNGFRLPTEAEWEYACRAGTNTLWHFGDDPSKLGDYEWYAVNSKGKIKPVGTKKPNRWGLHDMHGNVPEWCWDRYDPNYYKRSEAIDPAGSTLGTHRVFRGGHASYRFGQTTASTRSPLSLTYGLPALPPANVRVIGSRGVGIRVARSVK